MDYGVTGRPLQSVSDLQNTTDMLNRLRAQNGLPPLGQTGFAQLDQMRAAVGRESPLQDVLGAFEHRAFVRENPWVGLLYAGAAPVYDMLKRSRVNVPYIFNPATVRSNESPFQVQQAQQGLLDAWGVNQQ